MARGERTLCANAVDAYSGCASWATVRSSASTAYIAD